MEKWREIYSEENLKKLQNIEILILKEFIRLCEELNIDFFMYGGSLIGAVKFNGFVPWDDDIDVAMPRDDYEKLLKYGSQHLSDEFYLQTPLSDKKSPFPYAKLRLKGTEYVEYGFHKLNIEHGIYIDIYPIDKISTKKNESKVQFNEFKKWAKIFSRRQCPYYSSDNLGIKVTIKKITKFLLSVILHLIPRKYILSKMNKSATMYNNSQSFTYGNYYHATLVNIFNNIYPFKKGNFEGLEINLPNDFDGFLERRYGDYHELPPAEKRIGHKPYKLNFGKYK